jgi:hypothetical protein
MARDLHSGPLQSITLDDIEAFLSDAEDDEGLTWEAKSDDSKGRLSAHAIHKAACAFANSRHGGVIIVGARYVDADHRWELTGLRQPPTIPLRRWLDQQIRTGVTPAPVFDIRSFRGHADRGPVALVRVDPLPVKPAAVTRSGGIYVRTSTQSVPLQDPRLIADLFAEGDAARARAVDAATTVDATNLDEGPKQPSDYLSVTLCPVSWAADADVRILRRSTSGWLLDRVRRVAGPHRQIGGFQDADGLRAFGEGLVIWAHRRGPCVRIVRWDGMSDGLGLLQSGYFPAVLALAAEVIEYLGGSGETYLVAAIIYRAPGEALPVAYFSGWLRAPSAATDEIGWAARELVRRAGR